MVLRRPRGTKVEFVHMMQVGSKQFADELAMTIAPFDRGGNDLVRWRW